MAWNEKRSKERVNANDFSDFDLNVQDLARTMDFTNLGRKDVRRAKGVHLYVDVPNFHRVVVHGSVLPLEWLKVSVDPRVDAPAGESAFGPFSWGRVAP